MASDFHGSMGSYVHSRKHQMKIRSLTERVANKVIAVKLKIAHGLSKVSGISFGAKDEVSAERTAAPVDESQSLMHEPKSVVEEPIGEIKKLPLSHLQQLLKMSREKGMQGGDSSQESIPPPSVQLPPPATPTLLQLTSKVEQAQETSKKEPAPKKEGIRFGNFIRNFFHRIEGTQAVYESEVAGSSVQDAVAASHAQEVTPEKVDYLFEGSQPVAAEEALPPSVSSCSDDAGISPRGAVGQEAAGTLDSGEEIKGQPTTGIDEPASFEASGSQHGSHNVLGFISVQRASDYEREQETLRKAEESQREQEALAAQRLLEEEMEKVEVPIQKDESQETGSSVEDMGELFPEQEQKQKDVDQEEVIELGSGYRIQVVQNK
ncbi:hypothetical protein HYV84_07845 [Candidatus Woesearchaeota archaeon]|nr:hypothetical protein [Candidatus Woesearchaeota archaeon]